MLYITYIMHYHFLTAQTIQLGIIVVEYRDYNPKSLTSLISGPLKGSEGVGFPVNTRKHPPTQITKRRFLYGSRGALSFSNQKQQPQQQQKQNQQQKQQQMMNFNSNTNSNRSSSNSNSNNLLNLDASQLPSLANIDLTNLSNLRQIYKNKCVSVYIV